MQLIGSNAGDVTQTVTVSRRNAAGSLLTEVKTLNGTTAVLYTNDPERLEKAIKSATCAGDVAVEAQTATRSGTAQAGSAADITLDAGASGTDDFFTPMVIRLTGGTGSGQIRQIIKYIGATKVATVDRAWGTNPDGTTTFRVGPGFHFAKAPVEVMEVRRPFLAAGADAPGGANRKFYEKIFAENRHATLALLAAKVTELSDPSGLIAFALATTKDDTGTNGGGNTRLVSPSGLAAFDSADKAVVGDLLSPSETQGIWMEFTLLAGQAAVKTTYALGLEGSTT
jgi:hypothetical protein